jgi:cytochrome c oxidase subunit 2
VIAALKRALALAAPLGLAGCGGWQSALNANGASAIGLKQLIILIVAVCSVVWMLVMIALVRALWRDREERQRPTDIRPEAARRMGLVVTVAMAATAIVIGGFTVQSFFTTRAISAIGPDDLLIKVSGLQWWWNVQYFGATPAENFSTANEIHIPVRRNVRLHLEGDDVIHSFWVPSLAGKQDLIPGRPNDLALRAERPGVYRGQCAEFCGMQHAHMGVLIVAEPQADFDQWMRSQRQRAVQPGPGEAGEGKEIFLSKPCAACHSVRGTTASGTSGPDLTHVGSRKYIGAGLFETTRGSLAAWIADPQTLKAGNNMPLVPLTADELRAVSAYLASLK